ICDQIIPPDDDPGAVRAGVLNFVDRQLAGTYAHWQETYRNGIAEMDDASIEKYSKPFVELSNDQQVGLLKDRETTSFFRMARDHTMQGFYGDPRHGGNQDAVSWKMLGVESPPVRGRHHYDFNEG
ncbi:MAG: gluconate 2-dehydrogenase subunit 3 family protein, partial [bacterium]|nr:gluconate 2-dehydrogenase subunit 3 family protein [bacterium]